MYIADEYNYRIRFVSASTGIIRTFAGNGNGGYNGDGLAATAASCYSSGVAVDSSGRQSYLLMLVVSNHTNLS